ncbi:MAG: hypothetical protein FD146_49 [Anaerolineaceae bacterium]|nr:MAG: hypothetical protein FD146_49 [Anaerolineaceae bacterium]
MKNLPKALLLWSARILTILYIIFISMFALDIFSMGLTGWELVVGLFMHLLPSILFILALLIAGRSELAGGIVFLLLGGWFAWRWNEFGWLSAPLFVIAALFLLFWLVYRRKARK